MYEFEYQKPASLDDVTRLLGDEDAKLVAGGMTLIPTLKLRLAKPTQLIDLGAIPSLKGITDERDAVVIGATGAIALVYLVSMVLGFFHVNVPVLNDASPLGIILSLVIVGVAALNLILDFDLVESGVAQGAPRYMEWYAAFGLLVTLVWLYMEILRLLSKTRRS